jgi:V-type H+-transporting ATPase subunit G
MPPTDYVQRLMRAEEERNRIIAEARGRKTQKVKEAKADAERQVAELRKTKEAELERFQAQLNSTSETDKVQVVRETDAQIDAMKKLSSQRLDKVADVLVKMVCTF